MLIFNFEKMRYITFFLFFILFIFFQGCSKVSNKVSNIVTVEKPSFDLHSFEKSDSIKISDLLIAPVNWAVKNDKIVMLSRKNRDYFLYVFSIPDFKLLYKYGNYGHGPNEFVFVNWLNMVNDNQIGLYDIPNKRMYTYDLNQDTLFINKLFEFRNFESGLAPPYTFIHQIEGTMFIFKADFKQYTEIELININNGEIIQNFRSLLKREKNITTYIPYVFNISTNKNIIVFAYNFINRIELYRLNEEKLIEPFLIIGNQKDQADKSFNDYNVYYTDVHCNNSYIYALSQQGEKNEKIKNSSIEIYNLDGEPIKKITLDRHIQYFTLDDKNGVIYGNDSYVDFDYVYVYKIDI